MGTGFWTLMLPLGSLGSPAPIEDEKNSIQCNLESRNQRKNDQRHEVHRHHIREHGFLFKEEINTEVITDERKKGAHTRFQQFG